MWRSAHEQVVDADVAGAVEVRGAAGALLGGGCRGGEEGGREREEPHAGAGRCVGGSVGEALAG